MIIPFPIRMAVDSVTKRIQMNHPDFYAVIDVDKAVVQ